MKDILYMDLEEYLCVLVNTFMHRCRLYVQLKFNRGSKILLFSKSAKLILGKIVYLKGIHVLGKVPYIYNKVEMLNKHE